MSAPIDPRPVPTPINIYERDTLEDFDDLEDTQPSVFWPEGDDDFGEAPTIPGMRMRADGSVVFDESTLGADDEPQWDGVLRAVAVAVRRVFSSHSIS